MLAPGLEQAQVQLEHATSLSCGGDIALDDALGEALDHRRLAHAGLAGEHRVVLAAAHQDVDDWRIFLIALRRWGPSCRPWRSR